MSYYSKRTIVSTALGVILSIAYIACALGANAPASEDIKAWAVFMLVFIGIGIGSQIVIQILFHIVFAASVAVQEREKEENTVKRMISASLVEDERDKLIKLKASHVGYVVAGSGILGCLVLLAFGQSVVIGLHFLLGAFFLGALAEGIISVVLQERGV